jgi:hypothetical protein
MPVIWGFGAGKLQIKQLTLFHNTRFWE